MEQAMKVSSDLGGLCDWFGKCTWNARTRPSYESCSRQFYIAERGPPRMFEPCPGARALNICSRRGTCSGNATVNKSGLPATLAMLAVGHGNCTCSKDSFSGIMCGQGRCPEGSEELGPVLGSPPYCSSCAGGRYCMQASRCNSLRQQMC